MISVTDVIYDSDWVQPLNIVDREKLVDIATGKTVTMETPLLNYKGCLEPTSGIGEFQQEIFEMYPELDRSKQSMTLWSQAPVKVGITVLTWNNNEWLCKVIRDWGDYGTKGHTRAIFQRLDLEDA